MQQDVMTLWFVGTELGLIGYIMGIYAEYTGNLQGLIAFFIFMWVDIIILIYNIRKNIK